MKIKNILIILFAFISIGLITTAFQNGPANRGHDKTGSPVSSGSCFNCHSENNFSPSLMVGMFDSENEVNKYEPGKTYQLRYQLLNQGSPAVFGFQTVALNEENETVGTFSNIPDGFQEITLKEVNYVEHSSPRPLSTFEVDWTAPSNSTDEITIYSGGVAANGNSNNGGDGADMDVLVLTPNTSSSDNALVADADLFQIKGNLVQNEVELSWQNTYDAIQLYIYDFSGRIIYQETLNSSSNQVRIPLQGLKEGLYLIRFDQKQKSLVKRFL